MPSPQYAAHRSRIVSARRSLFLLLLILPGFLSMNAQNLTKHWDKTFGGSMSEEFRTMQQTSDGGYILGGYSYSGSSGDKLQSSQGGPDYWVVKTDSTGNLQWEKSFGGNNYDWMTSLQQTTDGGYILGGYSRSAAGGDKTHPNVGDWDYWIVKINSTGIKEWDKSFGGNEIDELYSIQQTSDGGYILGGRSKSGVSGQKSEPSQDLYDFWVVKVNVNGDKEWDRTFGGTDWDYLYSVQQTTDGGYILGGHVRVGVWDDDYWIVKIDSVGQKEWDKTYGGGNGVDRLYAIQQTPDGGYILGGESSSSISGDKSEARIFGMDYWLVKVNATGVKEWDRTFGGDGYDYLSSITQTMDGGYLMGGESTSGIGFDKSDSTLGSTDYWIVKVDSSGNKEWDKTFGGEGSEQLYSVKQTSDGGYILGGNSGSGSSSYKSQPSKGAGDYWIVKLGIGSIGTSIANISNSAPELSLYPNPLYNNSLNIELGKADKGSYYFTIYNCLGQKVAEQAVIHSGGTSHLTIHLEQLTPGHYYLQLTDVKGRRLAERRILKQ